jgi:hypothetical protein
MDINKIASEIDIGLILAETTGTLARHVIKVDQDRGTIDIWYTPIKPLDHVKITLTVGSKICAFSSIG